MRVLGVDPGARDTGIVLRAGDRLLHAETLTRAGEELFTGRGPGVGPVHLGHLNRALDRVWADTGGWDLAGIECVVAPSPHVNRRNGNAVIDVRPLLAAAIVLGDLQRHLADLAPVVWVPPGHNGSGALASYPPQLVSDAERRHGLNRIGEGGKLRHVRSAWDVSGQASLLARQQARRPATPLDSQPTTKTVR